MSFDPRRVLLFALVLQLIPRCAAAAPTARPPSPVRRPGHVLAALTGTRPLPRRAEADGEPVTLTVVLARSDQAGFDRYLHDVYDPSSPAFHRFLSSGEITARFGPTRERYDALRRHLQRQGFELVDAAANRLTLTVRGTRALAERVFDVTLADYELGGRRVFANDRDPALPAELAPTVQAVIGLNDVATPTPANLGTFATAINFLFRDAAFRFGALQIAGETGSVAILGGEGEVVVLSLEQLLIILYNIHFAEAAIGGVITLPSGARAGLLASDPVTGVGQTLGVVAFSGFRTSDVADFLALAGLPATRLANLSTIDVNGGAALGPDQTDVLLAIQTALLMAPDAKIQVYEGPFNGPGASFQSIFNAMINGGVTVISNSWTYCEDQTTRADVESIDAILATAAAQGISVFNATGDAGSACNGSTNVAAVPASSPHATAVGGSSPVFGPGYAYAGESWWDGTTDTPASGQGGYGVSQFFPRPAYQDGLVSGAFRSVPDVVAGANPKIGPHLCEADAGGCPTPLTYGGTSFSTPTWAVLAALLNDAADEPTGFFNPLLYTLANTSVFHTAADLGSDFAHVGLGSPNGNPLGLTLAGVTAGAVSASTSSVRAFPSVPFALFVGSVDADGTSTAAVRVLLTDANGNSVSGKTVALAGNPGSQAVITPAGAAPVDASGAVVFTVKDATVEQVVFTATDVTDGLPLTQTATITFTGKPATGGTINAFPTSVAADNATPTTITVTLQDGDGMGAIGKVVALSQGNGHSVITAPVPNVTDVNGQIQFTAVNQVNETITYTAVDVTDGNLPVPGNAQVTFSGGGTSCVDTANPPTADVGYVLTPFATGFFSAPLSFGGINFGFCAGIALPVFLDGRAIFPSFLNGDVFALPASGGAASSADKLATLGPTLGWSVVGKDGKLYATRVATNGDFNTGAVLELDPVTGAQKRVVAGNLRCPIGLVVDPLSGDLFYDDECFGNGANDPAIHRIRHPESAMPTVEVYATLPSSPNGNLAIAPNGSIYVVSNYLNSSAPVVRVSGTNGPATPTVTPLTGVPSLFWVNVAATDQDGEATKLITLSSDGKVLRLVDITAEPPTSTPIAHDIGGGLISSDGCFYASPDGRVVYKITASDGSCAFTSTEVRPVLALTPTTVAVHPVIGATQTFTATFENLTVPAGTPVTLAVVGANPGLVLGYTDANGVVTFTYPGVYAGDDLAFAAATVGGEQLISNQGRVTWDDGPHATFLGNLAPAGSVVGRATTLHAALFDISMLPPVPVAGASVTLEAGGQQCMATTGADGAASCDVTPATAGMTSLTATFAGTASLLPTTASIGFGSTLELANLETCDNCADDNSDTFVDRADGQCVARADGHGQGLGADAKRAKALLKCQRAIGKAGDGLVKVERKSLQGCTEKVAACVQQHPNDAACLAKAGGGCAKGVAKLQTAATKLATAVDKACGVKKIGAPPQVAAADLLAETGLGYVAEGVDCAERGVANLGLTANLARCVRLQHACKAEQLVSREVPRARELLALGGVDASAFGCLETNPGAGGAGLADAARAKALGKCQKGIGKAGAGFTTARSKRVKTCLAAVASCVQLRPGDAACLAKAQAKCAKQLAALTAGTKSAAAKARALIVKACTGKSGSLVADVLADAGLQFGAEAAACASLGVSPLATLDDVAECIVRHHACRVDQLLDKQVPRARELLAIGGGAP